MSDLTGSVIPPFREKLIRVKSVLTEDGPTANSGPWDQLAAKRGCKTPRDIRRLEHALCEEFKSTHMDDWSIIRVLDQLASSLLAEDLSACPLAEKTALETRRCISAILTTTRCSGPIPREELMDLMKITADPASARSSDDWFWSNQLVKFLSKYPFKGYEEESEDEAISLFLDCERQNAVTNATWTEKDSHPRISRVESRLAEILGTPPTLRDVAENGAWGPGTLNGYPFGSKMTGPELKYAVRPTITPLLIPIASRILATVPPWDAATKQIYGRHERFEVVEGSSLFTVPKKFLMDRCALKEPGVNAWMQAGLGRIMRERLRISSGVDLETSWRTNQELARVGSVTGIFATADLKSASDSVCRGPLKSIAPDTWYMLWESFASQSCLLPPSYVGRHSTPGTHQFQMMSSMGNGFTFELESILFYAIVTSIVPGVWTKRGSRHILQWPHVSVFGDDLVYPAAYHASVVELLEEFGFSINSLKSYASGPFRESCGKDFFLGDETRPLYVTKRLENGELVVNLANRILSVAHGRAEAHGCLHGFGSRTWHRAWMDVVHVLPYRLQELISTPPHVPHGLWSPRFAEDGDWETPAGQPSLYRVIAPVPVKLKLSSISLWFGEPVSDYRKSELWPVRLNGSNLMAARLKQIEGDPFDAGKRWLHVNMSSQGEWTTLRDTVSFTVTTRAVVESSRWRGFRALQRF